jgi:hypothetical protein
VGLTHCISLAQGLVPASPGKKRILEENKDKRSKRDKMAKRQRKETIGTKTTL